VKPRHPVFNAPENPDLSIWRYMDFAKFVDMLETGGLFMCRADKIGDPFEGTISQITLDWTRRSLIAQGIEKETAQRVVDMERERVRNFRQWHCINCWHMNDGESAAMWKLYAKSSDAVCIQSRFSVLDNLIDDTDVQLGCVTYIDYSTAIIPDNNSFWPFVHKRQSFAHENEVRLVSNRLMNTESEKEKFQTVSPDGYHCVGYEPPSVIGWTFLIDLQSLIEAVYVAPDSADWLLNLVNSICTRYALKAPVHRSSISNDPFL